MIKKRKPPAPPAEPTKKEKAQIRKTNIIQNLTEKQRQTLTGIKAFKPKKERTEKQKASTKALIEFNKRHRFNKVFIASYNGNIQTQTLGQIQFETQATKNKQFYLDIIYKVLKFDLEKNQGSPPPPEWFIIANNQRLPTNKIYDEFYIKSLLEPNITVSPLRKPTNTQPLLLTTAPPIQDGRNTLYNLSFSNNCVINEILNLTNGTRKGARTEEEILYTIYKTCKDIPFYKCSDDGNLIYDKQGKPEEAEITSDNIKRYGVNKDILIRICEVLKITLNMFFYDTIKGAFILQKETINTSTRKAAGLNLIINNNHIYLMEDLNTMKRYNNIINNIHNKTPLKKAEQKKKMNIIINDKNLSTYDFLRTAERLPDNIFISDNIICSFKIGDKKYVYNYDEDIKKELGDNYTGQTAGSIARQHMDGVNGVKCVSMGDKIYQALTADKVKHRTHIDTIEPFYFDRDGLPKENFNIKKYDLNKAYRYIMENLEVIYTLNITQEIKECNKLQGLGLYYVKPEKSGGVLHGKNWYSLDILLYCNEIGEAYDIYHYIECVDSKQSLKPMIEEIDRTYPENKKKIINSISGNCGITHKKGALCKITTDENQIFNFIDKNKKDIYLKKENDFWIYGFNQHINVYDNHLILYIQILDSFNILAHKRAIGTGGQLLARNIDAFYILNPTNEFHLSDKMGDYKKEAFKPLRNYNKIRDVEFKFFKDDINYMNITDNKYLSKEHLQNGLLITGRGGTGKTHIIKELLKDEEVIYIAPTNQAARLIGGFTIHNFLKINTDGEGGTYNKTVKNYLVIDEASMITGDIWIKILNFKRVNSHIKIVIMGDYHQLPSIEDIKYDFTKNDIILNLVNYNYMELKKNYRQDKEGLKVSDDIINGIIPKFNISKKEYEGVNICFFNKTRKEINDKRNIKSGLKIKLNEDEDIYGFLYEGVNVICNKTLKGQFYNGEPEEVLKVNGNNIYFKSGGSIDLKGFSSYFTLGYAITIYKAQGQTYDGKINIHDINYMVKNYKFIYTAISRATEYKNINFMV